MPIPPIFPQNVSSNTAPQSAPPAPSRAPLSPFLESSLKSISGTQNPILSCLKPLWDWLCASLRRLKNCLFPAAARITPVIAPNTDHGGFPNVNRAEMINPNAHSHHMTNPNKIFAYNTLVRGQSLGGPIDCLRYRLNDKSYISSCPMSMGLGTSHISSVGGPFSYTASGGNTTDWWANFADPHLMGFCGGPLLAQDEIQVLEHPPLAHVKTALPLRGLGFLRESEICLMKNVLRFGSLDIQTPLANGQSLYGNEFATASHAEISSRLTPLNPPQPSNIFFFAAPRISSPAGQPYQKAHLEQLFYSAFTAFWAAKQNSKNGNALIHTGNWGAGAFGNGVKTSHLIQIAAAYAAGVNVRFYPLDKEAEFQSALQLFNQLIAQDPLMSVDQLLTHLANHAQGYGLVYGQGNGT